MIRRPPRFTLFPYPPLFRSSRIRRRSHLSDQAKRRFPAHHGESLKQLFVLARQPVNARSENPLNGRRQRSEEHTSELQSPCNLVCRLLLEKKKKIHNH